MKHEETKLGIAAHVILHAQDNGEVEERVEEKGRPTNEQTWEYARMIVDKIKNSAKFPNVALSLNELDEATLVDEWFDSLQDFANGITENITP